MTSRVGPRISRGSFNRGVQPSNSLSYLELWTFRSLDNGSARARSFSRHSMPKLGNQRLQRKSRTTSPKVCCGDAAPSRHLHPPSTRRRADQMGDKSPDGDRSPFAPRLSSESWFDTFSSDGYDDPFRSRITVVDNYTSDICTRWNGKIVFRVTILNDLWNDFRLCFIIINNDRYYEIKKKLEPCWTPILHFISW